jgi:biopolymer transport protein ExbD
MPDQPNQPGPKKPAGDVVSRRPKADPASLTSVEGTETTHHEKRKKPKQGVAQLNLTSMMDVCFQLLIFFVLTASFAMGEGILPADLPTGESARSTDDPEPPDQPINIVLRSLGGQDVSIVLEGAAAAPANFEELFKTLKSVQNSPSNPTAPYNADDPVIIKPDATVPWGHVVNAFNSAIRARYTNVNFAQPQK